MCMKPSGPGNMRSTAPALWVQTITSSGGSGRTEGASVGRTTASEEPRAVRNLYTVFGRLWEHARLSAPVPHALTDASLSCGAQPVCEFRP